MIFGRRRWASSLTFLRIHNLDKCRVAQDTHNIQLCSLLKEEERSDENKTVKQKTLLRFLQLDHYQTMQD